MFVVNVHRSYCGDGTSLKCFDCGAVERLILVIDDEDLCVGGSEEARCGRCWAKQFVKHKEPEK